MEIIHSKVTIIAADTGAGKSTQVPQYLLDAGYRKVACTQPRRIACMSLAKRVAEETSSLEHSGVVGYQIRFDGTHTERTRLLFLTEGVLLRQYSGDASLAQYDVIVVDEVHERNVTGDFLLAILKRVLRQRPDLKLILMSATINAQLFSDYFNGAPLIEVPGKTYPVEIIYQPVEKDDANLVDERLVEERRDAACKQSIPAKGQKSGAKPYVNLLQQIGT